ncbi:MAG: cobyric acid synthase [Bacillota bacterium]
MAKTVMLQGTSSNVGKSVLTAALCRIFLEDGYRVAPFKAQNMALNSFVTLDGGEMGRAQVVQAQACKLEPDVLMNPILLKPTRHASSQVIVLGKPVGNLSAVDYHHKFKESAWKVICESLKTLIDQYELLVIEGAGSPAEINLKENDVVNMRVAKEITAPVLLVADIDRGGAIASIVGTLELLDPEERELIKGIIINKFRGDIALLQPALDFIKNKTGKPVLGVIPYFSDFKIPEEDSVALETCNNSSTNSQKLDIAVINLPHISNFTDFDALASENDVELRYVKKGKQLGTPDLIIIPGSKNTIGDMNYLEESNFSNDIKRLVLEKNVPVIGICGGYQILGKKLYDPHQTESDLIEYPGLGLLDIETEFLTNKITYRVKGVVKGSQGILRGCQNLNIEGYEIHMGITNFTGKLDTPFNLDIRGRESVLLNDGAISKNGLILGTYIHGIFDNDLLRRGLLNNIRVAKGWEPITSPTFNNKIEQEEAFDKLADLVRENIDMSFLYQLMELKV